MDQMPDSQEDFINNPSFRKWVKTPDESTSIYWENYLREHPEQQEKIIQAIESVKRLSRASQELVEVSDASAEEEKIWQRVKEQVQTPVLKKRPYWGWAAAAVIVIAGGLLWLNLGTPATKIEQTIAQQNPESLIDSVMVTNFEQKPRLVSLPDGSSVILQKGSNLRYENPFPKESRPVALSGEAYFEVVEDAKKPFTVYANGLIAKVLGTSFNVKAYEKDANVTVTVRTGKVFVTPEKDVQTKKNEREDMILTPNEQVVFTIKEAKMFRSPVNALAERKTFVIRPVNLVFNAVPVKDVFAEIEKAYGIKVVFKDPSLQNCRITTDLKEGTLSQKLDIICKTLEATWNTEAEFVAVTGRGCHP
ncbi:FecR domain-containing protein [Siphonobacter sp. SORGH_AS_0500]|uniref:FecR family protein n=1 Tax=Siphonobacter sp. SORGH_AS_0500 TaxID=1864824 RepID=UPI0028598847|nr:FecR domain-containing protein [Siphonobacter sp. SORGH_AS_0500]MDR6196956.1 transmembrane sensor [Siphonobacter sp. SORGH_AS_0500]